MPPRKFTNAHLVTCAEREVDQRKRVYERRVSQDKMTKSFADLQIAMMEEIATVLRELGEEGALL